MLAGVSRVPDVRGQPRHVKKGTKTVKMLDVILRAVILTFSVKRNSDGREVAVPMRS